VGRDGSEYTNDLRFLKIRIFFWKGLDRRTAIAQSASLICPSGHWCRLKQGRNSRSSSAPAVEVAVTNPDVRFIPANGLRRLGSPCLKGADFVAKVG
jgi:hypothetical protein